MASFAQLERAPAKGSGRPRAAGKLIAAGVAKARVTWQLGVDPLEAIPRARPEGVFPPQSGRCCERATGERFEGRRRRHCEALHLASVLAGAAQVLERRESDGIVGRLRRVAFFGCRVGDGLGQFDDMCPVISACDENSPAAGRDCLRDGFFDRFIEAAVAAVGIWDG